MRIKVKPYLNAKGNEMKKSLLVILALGMFSFPASATDVIAERKANFKANAGALRAIGGLLSAQDFDGIAAQADTVSRWAAVMPEYFPEGSESKGARDEIWFEFERFTALSLENKAAADAVIAAANANDAAAVRQAVQTLGATCKSCHSSFKN